jgi:signal transduction histidine kinase
MATAPAEAVDREIKVWIEEICLALDLDHGAIYERDAQGGKTRVSQMWSRPGLPAFPPHDDPQWHIEEVDDWLLAGKRIVFSRPSEIPSEFAGIGRFLKLYEQKAFAMLPMWAGGRVIGEASFARFHSPWKWTEQSLRRLEIAVRIFGSAIERKHAQSTARLVRAELALTQRRSMMGELMASLTHELNQPLGAIMSNLGGLARLLSQGNPEPERAAKAISNSIEDTRRASEIVRRVRAMFKGDHTPKVALDLGTLVSEVLRMTASEAALRGIDVRVEAPGSTPKVLGDQVLLRQCILNLMMNAFESLTKTDSEIRTVTIGLAPERPGWIAVRVSDNGAGVQASVADRLFEPFVTTKADGMGLGLVVTRSIVEEHGGQISVTAKAGGGAAFVFTLPVAQFKSRAVRRGSKRNRVWSKRASDKSH